MDPAPDGRAARASRSGAAVGAATLVALTAHLVGGGSAPEPLLLVAVLALAWPAGLVLVGGRPRLWRQAAVVGVAQAMLHGVFALGAPAVPIAADPMAGMHGHPLHLAAAAPMAHDPASMWWAHAAAWLLTTAAWRWGERALRALLQAAPLRRVLLLRSPAAPHAAPSAPVAGRRSAAPHAVLLAAHRDRGPPLPA